MVRVQFNDEWIVRFHVRCDKPPRHACNGALQPMFAGRGGAGAYAQTGPRVALAICQKRACHRCALCRRTREHAAATGQMLVPARWRAMAGRGETAACLSSSEG